ncbi:tyrosine recombinase XerC [Herbaspirillum sp. GCM10030257]|uniref:site-specific integrase n=1 Tax=Herbaspirillum sp. GCM10030257 TaxID=3273393 RepID=UPI00360B8439
MTLLTDPLSPAQLKRETARFKRDPLCAFADFVITSRFQALGPRPPARDKTGQLYPLGLQTVDQYTTMFRLYIEWLHEKHVPLLDADASHIIDFLNTPHKRQGKGKGGEKRSRVRRDYLRLLYRTYTHLGRSGDNNPALIAMAQMQGSRSALGIDAPKEFLNAAERDRFLKALPEVGATPTQWKRQRDRAMLVVMLGAGLKVAEIVSLQKRHVSLPGADGTRTITIVPEAVGGLSKKHKTFLRSFADPDLTAWLDTRARLKIPGDLLFPASRTGDKPLSKMTVYRMARDTYERAEIQKTRHGGRTLRNTFAIFELMNNRAPSEVSELLGHFEAKSVLGYVVAAARNRRAQK